MSLACEEKVELGRTKQALGASNEAVQGLSAPSSIVTHTQGCPRIWGLLCFMLNLTSPSNNPDTWQLHAMGSCASLTRFRRSASDDPGMGNGNCFLSWYIAQSTALYEEPQRRDWCWRLLTCQTSRKWRPKKDWNSNSELLRTTDPCRLDGTRRSSELVYISEV